MNKDEYYDWIDSQDTYPEHSHKWIVGLYTPDGGRFDMAGINDRFNNVYADSEFYKRSGANPTYTGK